MATAGGAPSRSVLALALVSALLLAAFLGLAAWLELSYDEAAAPPGVTLAIAIIEITPPSAPEPGPVAAAKPEPEPEPEVGPEAEPELEPKPEAVEKAPAAAPVPAPAEAALPISMAHGLPRHKPVQPIPARKPAPAAAPPPLPPPPPPPALQLIVEPEDLTACREATDLAGKGLPERQVELYSRCIESGRLEPANLALAHGDRGTVYRELGRPEPAFSDFTRALEIEPGLAAGRLNVGDLLRADGRPRQAIVSYDRALELDPKLATAYSNRGLAYKMTGRNQRALDDFGRALDLKPDFAGAYFNRCSTLFDMQRYDEAIADCQQALSHGRDRRTNAQAHNNLGQAHKAKGEYARAVSQFQAAIDALPAYAAPYNNLAWLHATAADPAFRDGVEALRLAREAVSRREQADTVDTLAAAQVENRRYDEAVAQYLRAMRLGGADMVKAYQQDLRAKGCYHGDSEGSLTMELRRALTVCVHEGRKLGAD